MDRGRLVGGRAPAGVVDPAEPPGTEPGRKAIEAQDWAGAIRFFSSAALRDTRNSDIQNYLGFAYRNTGELSLAFNHYNRALLLNPRHRGAHEYLGEAYLMAGNVAKAEEHLAALERIAPPMLTGEIPLMAFGGPPPMKTAGYKDESSKFPMTVLVVAIALAILAFVAIAFL